MSRPPGARAAYAALGRGTAFLRANLAGRSEPVSPMVAGNGLAELDRLFHVLIAQAARDRRVDLSAGPRGNADRLATLCGAHADGDRLRALLRSTTCLRRHDGRARHADRRGCGFMTVGWSSSGSIGLHKVKLGASVLPSANQLTDVCAFYDRLARRVVAGHPDIRLAKPLRGLVLLAA